MSTAAPGSWTPVDASAGRGRWWTAVACGVAAPVLLTPLGDLVPEPWRTGTILGLALVAAVVGLAPTVRALAGREAPRPGPGAALLGLAVVLGIAGGAGLAVVTGSAVLPAAAGLAVAAHLVAARLLRGLLASLPGADAPRRTAPATSSLHGDVQVDAQDPWHRLADRALRALPWLAGLFAVMAAGAAMLTAPAGTSPAEPATIQRAAEAALAVLLVASPASFLLARLLPGRASRDRGRELGIVYGDADLRRTGQVSCLLVDPLETLTDDLPRLVRVHPYGRLQATAALQAAASVAAGSSVPAHRSLVAAARGRAIEVRPTQPAGDDVATSPTRHRYIKNMLVTLGPPAAFDRVPVDLEGRTLYVGWGGVARAAFELVPQVRSAALTDWSEVSTLRLRPVFVSDDPVGLGHVADAMEVPQIDRHVAPGGSWREVVERLDVNGRIGVLGAFSRQADADQVVAFEPATLRTPLTRPEATVRLERLDMASAVRAVGLARKTGRVTAQSTLLALGVEAVAVLAAVGGVLPATAAAVLGALIPLVVAANALRPRSYARTSAES